MMSCFSAANACRDSGRRLLTVGVHLHKRIVQHQEAILLRQEARGHGQAQRQRQGVPRAGGKQVPRQALPRAVVEPAGKGPVHVDAAVTALGHHRHHVVHPALETDVDHAVALFQQARGKEMDPPQGLPRRRADWKTASASFTSGGALFRGFVRRVLLQGLLLHLQPPQLHLEAIEARLRLLEA